MNGPAALVTLVTKPAEEVPSSRYYCDCEESLPNLRRQGYISNGEHDFSKSDRCSWISSEPSLACDGEHSHLSNDGSMSKREDKWEADGVKREAEILYQEPSEVENSTQELEKNQRKQRTTRIIAPAASQIDRRDQESVPSTISMAPQSIVNSPTLTTCGEKTAFLADDHSPGKSGVLQSKIHEVVKVQPTVKMAPASQKDQLIAEVSKLFDLAEEAIISRMRSFYTSRTKAAFNPRETDRDGEIFPKVIKPLWAHAIHTQDCAMLMRESVQNMKMEAKTKGIDTSSAYKQNLRKVLEILEPHLRTTNRQNHLPLSRMDDTMYRKLQLIWNSNPEIFFQIEPILSSRLSKYELHRRLTTLTNQIIQKTAIENWKLISKALADMGHKRRVNQFLKSLERNFELDKEFPDLLNYFELWTKNPGIFKSSLGKPKHDAGSLMMTILGPFEFRRRFNFAVLSHQWFDLKLDFQPQTELPLVVKEDLQSAEKSNGVNLLNVCCLIRYLGLGQPKSFGDSTDNKVLADFERVLRLFNCETYWYVPWFESADRAWLIKTFPEYLERLNDLCTENKKRYIKSIEGQEEKAGRTDENVIDFYREDQVLFHDQGIPLHDIEALEKLRAANTQLKSFTIPTQEQTSMEWLLL
ncbi:hypothetical protein PtA15_4A102 [Puccinia triticina]|uniref:Uncharacterized protein n=1 Tax=Puccinia triticina TaxID=208348 RepID=A0ABY7CEM1_9BASI|nr:uncharacterized protein PtA15_4A102 [Puccinia triticina]WAQ83654.1 hypothetical protein PtA15_4A102 [Puccinia triticina]